MFSDNPLMRTLEERNRLVEENLAAVQKALRYCFPGGPNDRRLRRAGMTWDDAAQVGCLAMMRAAELWREDGGASFSTYAINFIKWRMREEFLSGGIIHVPADAVTGVGKYGEMPKHCDMARKARHAALFGGLDPEVSTPEEHFGILSRDDPVEEAMERERARLNRERCDELLRFLNPRQRQVVRLRLWEGMLLEDVGAVMGVSKQRVQQMEEQAMCRLRRLAQRAAVA